MNEQAGLNNFRTESDGSTFAPIDELLALVERYRDEIESSDKETPEHFHDLHPVSEGFAPEYFLVPRALSASSMRRDSVSIANYRVFLRNHANRPGIFRITGDHHSFGVAIRIGEMTDSIAGDLESLADYASLDDMETAKTEQEQIEDAWRNWARSAFSLALQTRFPTEEETIGNLGSEQVDVLFERGRLRGRVEWVEDSTGMFIDVRQVALAIERNDLSA